MSGRRILIPKKHPSRSALRPSPLTELREQERKGLENILTLGEAHLRQEFKGITTDGRIVPGLFPIQATGVSVQPIVEAAKAFWDSLSVEERKAIFFGVDSIQWRAWHNAHPYLFRHGLCLEYLSEPKRNGALGLVRQTMSASGFECARNVMRLNEYVRELTGRSEEFGEWYYFVSVFGEPSGTTPWGWQLDGHHLNINCFVLGDQLILTPTFFGSEPVSADSGKYAGIRVFAEEEAKGYALMSALTPEQQDRAVISTEFPLVLFTAPALKSEPADNLVLKHEGIGYEELTQPQKELLLELIDVYIGKIRPGHAEVRFAEVRRHLAETRFAWIGKCDEVSPFYYRIHSPVVLIEFDHQRGTAFENDLPTRDHIHTLIRTPNGNDYGRDLLRQHYEQFDHSHPHSLHRMGRE